MLRAMANPKINISDTNYEKNLVENSILPTYLYSFFKSSGFKSGIVSSWYGNEKRGFLDFDRLRRIIMPIHLVFYNFYPYKV